MRRQRVPMCTAIRDTMPPHTVVLYICCSILLLPYSAQVSSLEEVIIGLLQ
ncbi:hypothetical protein Tcan_17378 [Toxocara canis]|uniref:Uncharacterized protein n=1 Tax=Toxocara canis TaxID=6265 RepID=A0A0B2UPJ4_TOXCA|nr:hypothetical protein Tcan_17378 [Toxocara canis]